MNSIINSRPATEQLVDPAQSLFNLSGRYNKKGNGLNLAQSQEIIKIARDFLNTPLSEEEEKGQGQKIPKAEYELGRSLLLLPSASGGKQCYVLFTSSQKKGDELLGKGKYKRVKNAALLDLAKGNHKLLAVAATTNTCHSGPSYAICASKKEVSCFKDLSGIPEIVHFENSLEYGRKFYLLMERCDYGCLQSFLQDKDAPKLEDIQKHQLAADIANGLASMHMRGWYHCDVKGENVLITSDLRAKIADLGLAVNDQIFNSKDWEPLTTTNFMSPDLISAINKGVENISNRAELLEKADAWALGLVLFTLFHPKHLWLGFQKIDANTRQRILQVTQEYIHRSMNVVPDNLFAKNVIQNLLQVDPETRWSVKKAAEVLCGFMQSVKSNLHLDHSLEKAIQALNIE